ncbi:hypothetical protein MP228_004850 [Amoeboaphelidium protococcarum]|nr:hypothetical protein MP228_004850 [Amoeboaphelidium protococcarum]
MCIVLWAQDVHPKYKLVLVSNRDEFFDRRTDPAHVWTDRAEDEVILGGRDLEGGGSWLGVSASRCRVAAITNYREVQLPDKPGSRGLVINRYLEGESIALLNQEKHRYGGFNLISFDFKDGSVCNMISNRLEQKVPLKLESGKVYGVSNGLYDERRQWPKVERGVQLLESVLSKPHQSEGEMVEELFTLMKDTTSFPQEILPRTGMPPEVEAALCSIFIPPIDKDSGILRGKGMYGTRSTTVILITNDGGNGVMHERCHIPHSTQKDVELRFKFQQ